MACVFEVRGRLAMFRKGYTTTSSVSFPLPPPTSLGGLLGAVLGFDSGAAMAGENAHFWNRLEGTRIALRILEPLRYYRGTVNFWNVKNPQKNAHIQVKHQFLRDVAYRVYVEGPLENALEARLSKGEFVYTPFLGVAYALADLRWIGRRERGSVREGAVEVTSVVPDAKGLVLDVLASGGAFREVVPFRMTRERALAQTISVYFAPDPAKPLVLKERGDADVARCGDDVVAFFPAW
jgi:CRISPR-associated protein Cas5h